MVAGVERVFYDYIARGVPFGPDDGTLAPWAVVASLPFAPEIVLPTIQNYERMELEAARDYGYKASFNPTFPVQPKHEHGWVSPYNFGLNQGPIVLSWDDGRANAIRKPGAPSASLRVRLVNRVGFSPHSEARRSAAI